MLFYSLSRFVFILTNECMYFSSTWKKSGHSISGLARWTQCPSVTTAAGSVLLHVQPLSRLQLPVLPSAVYPSSDSAHILPPPCLLPDCSVAGGPQDPSPASCFTSWTHRDPRKLIRLRACVQSVTVRGGGFKEAEGKALGESGRNWARACGGPPRRTAWLCSVPPKWCVNTRKPEEAHHSVGVQGFYRPLVTQAGQTSATRTPAPGAQRPSPQTALLAPTSWSDWCGARAAGIGKHYQGE